jgi:hypothetical protein
MSTKTEKREILDELLDIGNVYISEHTLEQLFKKHPHKKEFRDKLIDRYEERTYPQREQWTATLQKTL